MVCVPCFVIPVVLWIFHRFVRPLVKPLLGERYDRFYDWWTDKLLWFLPKSVKKDADGKPVAETNGRCPMKVWFVLNVIITYR